MTTLAEINKKLEDAQQLIPGNIAKAFEMVKECRLPAHVRGANKARSKRSGVNPSRMMGAGFMDGIATYLPDNETTFPAYITDTIPTFST